MSLNWREIDHILQELKLEGNFIQDIIQPDYSSLLLRLYSRDIGRRNLYISLKPGKTRLHTIEKSLKREIKLQRFAQLLRSRLKGCRIEGASQIAGQRLVELVIRQGESSLILWLRLWGNAANILLCREDGEIIDAFYRRPGRDEQSGAFFLPREIEYAPPPEHFTLRPYDEALGFNRSIELAYAGKEEAELFDQRYKELIRGWNRLLTSQEALLETYRRRTTSGSDSGALRHSGDLILANLHRINKGDAWVTVEDYENGSELSIQLDPRLNPQENAESYYSRQRKADKRTERAADELQEQEDLVEQTRRILGQIEDCTDLDSLLQIPRPKKSLADNEQPGAPRASLPGLLFLRGEWQILVGRNARESDTILRSWAKGNDYWIHTRDYPGGHVFIRGPKGKSIPLEILLDGGNLAVHYSKGKANGGADCYYTRVKYLRRPRDGKIGTVLPTQEKNLDIRLDQQRVEELLHGSAHKQAAG